MEQLLKLLKEKHLTLGSVESMTGGLFASEFTSVSGASKVFLGSLITYSAQEKINLAHVSKDTINEFGVISEEVAIEMAEGGRESLGADICVSVTGNAGPTSDVGDKPVGEVHIAVAYKEATYHEKISLKGERNYIRSMSVQKMKDLISFVVQKDA